MVSLRVKQTREGFTLLELMIALVVVGLVFAGGFVGFRALTEQAKKTATNETLNANAIALSAYYSDMDNYPAKLIHLRKKPANPEEAAKWGPHPYVKSDKAFRDGWKKKLIYKPSGDRQSYELYSATKKNLRVTSE